MPSPFNRRPHHHYKHHSLCNCNLLINLNLNHLCSHCLFNNSMSVHHSISNKLQRCYRSCNCNHRRKHSKPTRSNLIQLLSNTYKHKHSSNHLLFCNQPHNHRCKFRRPIPSSHLQTNSPPLPTNHNKLHHKHPNRWTNHTNFFSHSSSSSSSHIV